MKRFTIEIEMENDAMRTSTDLICALKEVIAQIRETNKANLRPVHSRRIFDINGNTVGSWNISEE